VVNAEFQESLSGVREAQAFAHEAATEAHFQSLGRLPAIEARRPAPVALYFPFVQLLSSVADAIVLGWAPTSSARAADHRRAVRLSFLYVDMFFSPIQALSQVFDSWQQSRVSVRRITDLMAPSDADARSGTAGGSARRRPASPRRCALLLPIVRSEPGRQAGRSTGCAGSGVSV